MPNNNFEIYWDVENRKIGEHKHANVIKSS